MCTVRRGGPGSRATEAHRSCAGLLWCTDITEHLTRHSKVYCCAVLDVLARQVVGRSIADHRRSDLVVDAFQMATWRSRPEPGTIFHADPDKTPRRCSRQLRQAGLLGSMGRVASSVDNSITASFWYAM